MQYLNFRNLHGWALSQEKIFMVEMMKVSKFDKLVSNLSNKEKYVVHIRAFSQALKHGLMLERVQ